MSIDWLDVHVRAAVVNFWKVRDGGKGVREGKTLDLFIGIVRKVIEECGLEDVVIHTGRYNAQLPGYFRPSKAWDVAVVSDGELVAAIEFKSQVGSISKNFNNRNEEVLGSSIDLKTAIEESAFGIDSTIFTGYLILVEDGKESRVNPSIEMKYFPVMSGFLENEERDRPEYKCDENGLFPKMTGISYIDRYDLMCKRLMKKGLYTAAAVITAPNNSHSHDSGDYGYASPETSIETFMSKLQGHFSTIASIQKQRRERS